MFKFLVWDPLVIIEAGIVLTVNVESASRLRHSRYVISFTCQEMTVQHFPARATSMLAAGDTDRPVR